jgi:hypothetical protein
VLSVPGTRPSGNPSMTIAPRRAAARGTNRRDRRLTTHPKRFIQSPRCRPMRQTRTPGGQNRPVAKPTWSLREDEWDFRTLGEKAQPASSRATTEIRTSGPASLPHRPYEEEICDRPKPRGLHSAHTSSYSAVRLSDQSPSSPCFVEPTKCTVGGRNTGTELDDPVLDQAQPTRESQSFAF